MGRLALPAPSRPQRFLSKQGNIAYSSGVTTNQAISQTDYLTSVLVTSNQTVVTGASAPVVAGYGAYGALSNVQVRVNGGRAPFSMPGYGVNEYNKLWNHDYTDALVADPIVTNSTNQWKNHLKIPLTIDPITEKGAWYTGDTQLNLTVSLTNAAVGTVLSTVSSATIGGSWDVWSEKFSAPAPDEPGGWLEEISYYQQAELYGSYTLSNGTTSITLETDQDYLRIMMVFYTGSNSDSTFAPANGLWTSMSLVVNDKFNIFDSIDEQTLRFEMLETYGPISTSAVTTAAGTVALDFFRIFPPTRRDILPTDADKAKRLQLKIASTSASNKVDVYTQTVMDSQFAERWIRAAQARGGK